MEIWFKEILWLITILIMIPQDILYLRSIFRWVTKPHIYTRLIWFLLMWVGFLIQYMNWWWPWTWVLWWAAIFQLAIVILSIKFWTKDITKFDTILLILSLLLIIVYLWIEEKLYALIMLIIIDMIAYLPTIRKTYNAPYSEDLFVWNIWSFKYVLSIFALSQYSFYTMAYPTAIIFMNVLFVWIILFKRIKLINS